MTETIPNQAIDHLKTIKKFVEVMSRCETVEGFNRHVAELQRVVDMAIEAAEKISTPNNNNYV